MTEIEWTDKTYNPFEGCIRVSEGCKYCWAEKTNNRLASFGRIVNQKANWQGNQVFNDAVLHEPWTYNSQKVFVCSRSDLFLAQREQINLIMAACLMNPSNKYQILTKRPEKMFAWIKNLDLLEMRLQMEKWIKNNAPLQLSDKRKQQLPEMLKNITNPNWESIWLGVSAENQKRFDERMHYLKQIDYPVLKWVSAEPLLSPLSRIELYAQHLHWLVVGGENGPRECKEEWIQSIVQECRATSLPVYVKQMGSVWAKNCQPTHPSKSKRGAIPDEWPEDIRVREFPQIKTQSQQLALF